MSRRRIRRRRIQPEEMNITAFMNLMVVLVPFLLITAVFTRLTSLELNLPAASAGGPAETTELQLEVTIRADALELGERSRGLLKRIEKGAGGYDYAELTRTLRQIKERFPEKTEITILSERKTSYQTLVDVMDAVRVYQVTSDGTKTRYELFPDISIGDAPLRTGAAPETAPLRTARAGN